MKVRDEALSARGGDAPADSTLSAVARELCDDEMGIVVVGTPANPVGVVSERDVVRAVATMADEWPEE